MPQHSDGKGRGGSETDRAINTPFYKVNCVLTCRLKKRDKKESLLFIWIHKEVELLDYVRA